MSYTIDVYRGEVAAQKNILTFATYVTLFPQLIAGPIVQYKTVEKELMHRKVTLEDFSEGAFRFSVQGRRRRRRLPDHQVRPNLINR